MHTDAPTFRWLRLPGFLNCDLDQYTAAVQQGFAVGHPKIFHGSPVTPQPPRRV